MKATTLLRGALALALVLALAPADAQQLWKWSQTPATNATADPAINWATGMAPSAVSPSARAMMSAVAKFRDDRAGSIITGGTTTAYTATSSSSYAATPNEGTRISVRMHLTNGANPTLAVDGGTAFPIYASTSGAVPAATLVAGSPYDFVFASCCNVWLVAGVTGAPTTIPIGGLIDYVGASAPNSNFALPAGQCISRTTYAALFALTGTTYSTCDGSTTFGLPDLRGRVVAGLDNMGSSAASRLTTGTAGFNADATVMGNTGGNQSQSLNVNNLPPFTPSGSVSGFTPSGTISAFNPASSINSFTPTGSVGVTMKLGSFNAATVLGTNGANNDVVSNAGNGFAQQPPSFTTSFSGNAVTLSGGNITPTFSGNAVTPTFTGVAIGSGFGFALVQPTMVLNKLIRIF